jgi:hypothetical protein
MRNATTFNWRFNYPCALTHFTESYKVRRSVSKEVQQNFVIYTGCIVGLMQGYKKCNIHFGSLFHDAFPVTIRHPDIRRKHGSMWAFTLIAVTLYISVYQTVVRGGLGKKMIAKIVRHWLNEKYTHVCATTALVCWHSTKCRRISSFRKFLFLNHYVIKYFKLVHRRSVVVVTSTAGIMFLLFSCMHFWVLGIVRRRSACDVPPIKWSATAWSLGTAAL